MTTIPLIKTHCVRDLAWSCFGQNLINDFADIGSTDSVQRCHIRLTEARQQWLQQLDQNPAPLLNHLKQLRSPRIGLYFEALWQFFIQHDAQLELLAHNLQVSQNKQTVGEFDLIYRDISTGHHYHLELAIKFYLNKSLTLKSAIFSSDFKHWLGPNAIDRLDIKTEHLLNHQTQLSANEAGKAALSRLGVDQVITEIAIKGQLYYPLRINPPPSSVTLSPNHDYGHWINLSKLERIIQNTGDWVILNRSEWISPVYAAIAELTDRVKNPLSLQAILTVYFSNNMQPVMICALEQVGEHYREKLRFFITHDRWPEKLRHS